jgi:hypothetical protein
MEVVWFALLCIGLVLFLCALGRALAPFLPGLLLIAGAIIAVLKILPADDHPHEASPVAVAILALMVAFFIFIVVRGIIRSLRGVRAVPLPVPRADAPRRLISVEELIAPPVKLPPDPEIEALKLKLKLELDRAEPPWLGYRSPPN